jgi:hypothetical protein
MTNLPKGVIFGHIIVCGILSKLDQLKINLYRTTPEITTEDAPLWH